MHIWVNLCAICLSSTWGETFFRVYIFIYLLHIKLLTTPDSAHTFAKVSITEKKGT